MKHCCEEFREAIKYEMIQKPDRKMEVYSFWKSGFHQGKRLESLSMRIFEFKYCPFCGEKLAGSIKNLK